MYPDYSSFSSTYVVVYVVLVVLSVIAAFLLAIIPSKIARNKGYSGAGFYWFGVAALVPAIIVACVLRNRKATTTEPGTQTVINDPPQT